MDRRIFYCPSCKTSDLNMKLTCREIDEVKTGVLVGERVIPYIICPHCNYVLAGLRNARDTEEENEMELQLLKMYTGITGDNYIRFIYEELKEKAKLRISEKLKYHKSMVDKLEKVKYE